MARNGRIGSPLTHPFWIVLVCPPSSMAIDLVDGWYTGRMLAGFNAAQVLDADSRQLRQSALRQADGDAIADDLAGQAGAGILTAG